MSLCDHYTIDNRVNEFTGYCPSCPIHEGVRSHVRLDELTREFRQCPRCKRIYVVAESPLAVVAVYPFDGTTTER